MSIRTNRDEVGDEGKCAEFSILQPRVVKLTTRTEVDVRRTLPHKNLRMIGAWCFVDHYGPTNQVTGMTIGAHPHMGLQTVTWLFDGRIMHNDSLGTHQEINPAQLNLMTAGRGIAHSEQSLESNSTMHGVQLWIALPLEYEIHSLRTSENQKLAAPTWRLQNQLRLTERKKTFASDREIGFWLGCRHPHMWLGKEATPQLLAGLGSASGWRSLVLAIDRRRVDLATLLRPLIDELGAGYSSAPRELFIQIEGHWEESPLVVPDALWNGRVEW